MENSKRTSSSPRADEVPSTSRWDTPFSIGNPWPSIEKRIRDLWQRYGSVLLTCHARHFWLGGDFQALSEVFCQWAIEAYYARLHDPPQRLRVLLWDCLQRFVHETTRTQSASADAPEPQTQPASPEPAEQAAWRIELAAELDRELALAVHRRTMRRLEKAYDRRGQLDQFRALRRFVFHRDKRNRCVAIGHRLGWTPEAVKQEIFALREAYYDTFREEVGQITAPQVQHEEVRYLMTLLNPRRQSRKEDRNPGDRPS